MCHFCCLSVFVLLFHCLVYCCTVFLVLNIINLWVVVTLPFSHWVVVSCVVLHVVFIVICHLVHCVLSHQAYTVLWGNAHLIMWETKACIQRCEGWEKTASPCGNSLKCARSIASRWPSCFVIPYYRWIVKLMTHSTVWSMLLFMYLWILTGEKWSKKQTSWYIRTLVFQQKLEVNSTENSVSHETCS